MSTETYHPCGFARETVSQDYLLLLKLEGSFRAGEYFVCAVVLLSKYQHVYNYAVYPSFRAAAH